LFWNRIANRVATANSLNLIANAHLFALLNLAMADATIACWDAKYRHVFWRPITAIRTVDDPAWKPWLDFFPAGTPAHPEYVSGHSTLSGSAAFILASLFGDDTAFTIDSEVRPGTRSFPSFSAAVAEILDARVFGASISGPPACGAPRSGERWPTMSLNTRYVLVATKEMMSLDAARRMGATDSAVAKTMRSRHEEP
jgi:hypothetical protein